MRLRAISTTPATTEVDVLAVPIYRDESDLDGDLADLDQASGGAIRAAIDWGEFNPVEHASALVDAGTLPAGRLLLLNAGARGRGAWRARRLAAVATRRLNGRDVRTLGLWLRDDEGDREWSAAAAGAVAGTYRPTSIYGRVRDTEAMARSVEEVQVIGADQDALDEGAGSRRGDGVRPRPGEPRGERSDPGADGRDRPRAGGRWLHGRGAGAGRHGATGHGLPARRRPGRRATRRGSSPSSCRAGRAAATGGWRSSGRASASTPAASASSQATGWGT